MCRMTLKEPSKMRTRTRKKHKASHAAPRRHGNATAADNTYTLDTLVQALRSALSSQPKPAALEDWLPGSIVCDMLNISLRTLENWRTKKLIPYSKVENKCYYRRSDIEALLQNNLSRKEGRDE